VHDLNVLLDPIGQKQLIGLILRRGKHDSLATAVADEDVSKGCRAVVVRHVDGEVLDCFGRLVFEVLNQVDETVVGLKEDIANVRNPPRNSG